MKVLLIQAPLGRQDQPIYPLGLAYLAGALHEEHEVLMADANLQAWPEIHWTIKQFQPDVIGLGLKNIDTAQSYDPYSYFQHFPAFVTRVKDAARWSILVVGGTGFSLFPKVVMKTCVEIDFGIKLEGEESFPILLEKLDNPESVPGVYYRVGKEVLFSGPSRFPDFATLPNPLRLLDPSLYQQKIDQLGVMCKRGCTYQCLYCNYPYLNGNVLRIRNPKSVVNELAQLKKDYGIRCFFFADAIFNEPKEYAEAIMEGMLRQGLRLRWAAYFLMKHFDRPFLELASRSGCELFEFSPDGLHQTTLNGLQKEITEEELRSTMELFRGVNFPKFTLCLMFNVPGSSIRDFLLLYRVVSSWSRKYRGLADVTITNMRIYPNTSLHEFAVEKGIVDLDKDLIQPTFYDPWPLNLFSKLINKKSLYRFRGAD